MKRDRTRKGAPKGAPRLRLVPARAPEPDEDTNPWAELRGEGEAFVRELERGGAQGADGEQ
jgi:hypothetical protein